MTPNTKPRKVPLDTPCSNPQCGHEKLVHNTTSRGRNAASCAMIHCPCSKFVAGAKNTVGRRQPVRVNPEQGELWQGET